MSKRQSTPIFANLPSAAIEDCAALRLYHDVEGPPADPAVVRATAWLVEEVKEVIAELQNLGFDALAEVVPNIRADVAVAWDCCEHAVSWLHDSAAAYSRHCGSGKGRARVRYYVLYSVKDVMELVRACSELAVGGVDIATGIDLAWSGARSLATECVQVLDRCVALLRAVTDCLLWNSKAEEIRGNGRYAAHRPAIRRALPEFIGIMRVLETARNEGRAALAQTTSDLG